MARITFYTKIGCLTSAKQVDLLQLSGHDVDVCDLQFKRAFKRCRSVSLNIVPDRLVHHSYGFFVSYFGEFSLTYKGFESS
jgi:hypothetical protein